jgi:hypothetical protein
LHLAHGAFGRARISTRCTSPGRAAFDVHVSGAVAATLERDSGELRVRRLAGGSEAVVEFVAGLAGPVRATYEAEPTGFVLARRLETMGVDCLVCAPGLIPAR